MKGLYKNCSVTYNRRCRATGPDPRRTVGGHVTDTKESHLLSETLLRRSPHLLIALLALSAVLFAPGVGQSEWPISVPIRAALAADAPLPVNIYLPSNAAARGPLPILLAIHG